MGCAQSKRKHTLSWNDLRPLVGEQWVARAMNETHLIWKGEQMRKDEQTIHAPLNVADYRSSRLPLRDVANEVGHLLL